MDIDSEAASAAVSSSLHADILNSAITELNKNNTRKAGGTLFTFDEISKNLEAIDPAAAGPEETATKVLHVVTMKEKFDAIESKYPSMLAYVRPLFDTVKDKFLRGLGDNNKNKLSEEELNKREKRGDNLAKKIVARRPYV